MNRNSFLKPENTLAIINGKKSRQKEIRNLLGIMKQEGINIKITHEPGDATTFAAKAKDFKTLVAVGGDGTLFEIINGMDLNLQQVGLIPAGTVNCIAHFMKYKGVLDAYNKLQSGKIQEVDLITVKLYKTSGIFYKKLFLGFLAAGHLAGLTNIAGKFSIFPKILRYSIATLLNTLFLSKIECTIKIGNRVDEEKTITSFIINNGFSHFFSFVPSWTLYDGTVEIEAVKRTRPVQFVYNFNRILPVFHSRSWQSGINTIECTFKKPQSIMGDGELFRGIKKIETSILQKKLKICCPSGIELAFGK